MKIALIHPPEPVKSIGSEIVQHPINLAQLAAYVRERGHEPAIWDYAVMPLDKESFIQKVNRSGIEAAGFSCMTPLVKTGHKMAAWIKETNRDILTIVGGPHVSAVPERTLSEFGAFDLGVRGEGELVLADILDAAQSGKSFDGVAGTVTRKSEGVEVAPLRDLIEPLDDLPLPARDLIDFSLYRGSSSPGISADSLRITEMFTSRGCPVACIFCGSHITHRGKVRFRSSAHVLREAAHCKDAFGVEHFTIDDDTFTYGKKRLLEIAEGLGSLGVTWDCDSRVDSIDETTLKFMAGHGCVKIAFGVESASPRMLSLIKKRINIDQIAQAILNAKKANIITSAFIMVGSHPSETAEDLDLTLRFIKRLSPDYMMVYIAVPFPGTELNEMMKSEGFLISEDWDDYDIVRTIPAWRTQFFTPEQLVAQQRRMYRNFYFRPAFIAKKLFSLRTAQDWKYLFTAGFRFARYVLVEKRFRAADVGKGVLR